MRPKHIFAILLLASLGLIAVLFIRARNHDTVGATAPAAISAAVEHDEILVAARPLPQGLLLRTQDAAWHERTGDALPGEIVRPPAETRAAKPESDEAARANVSGAALRRPLDEGQPIRRSDIVKPHDRDFLQTVLSRGTRALSIPVSAAAGGTGLMFPGDHVDVMLTQSFKNEDAPLTRRSVSETVVEDLRVLAIEAGGRAAAGSTAITVTLEVQPQQAEKINVAEELGKLSLTLRSIEETSAPAPGVATAPASAPPPTWAGDVSPALKSAMPPAKVIQAEKPAVKVMRGPNETKTQ